MKRFFLIFVLLLFSSAARAADFYLKGADRVVFYGDSITAQNLYTSFVESFVVTRFPALHVRFINSGWGGDRVSGGNGGTIEARLQRDVAAFKPTVVTVNLGLNDGGWRAFDQELYNKFALGMENIVGLLRAQLPSARITLLTPTPFDDITRPPRFEGGYNKVMQNYGAFVQDLAARQNLGIADVNTPVVAALMEANRQDNALAQKMMGDRAHAGEGGHLLFAAELLKAWNAPPTATAVVIDVAPVNALDATPQTKPKVFYAQNTKVTWLQKEAGFAPTPGSFSWLQDDKALPMPLDLKDAALMLAVKSSDFLQQLDKQFLIVRNLPFARYQLKIDGRNIGIYTREEWESGVNLAALPTPMLEQAQKVHALTLEHNRIHLLRWRQLQIPLADQMTPAAVQALAAVDALEDDLVARQNALARPVPHQYELTPVT